MKCMKPAGNVPFAWSILPYIVYLKQNVYLYNILMSKHYLFIAYIYYKAIFRLWGDHILQVRALVISPETLACQSRDLDISNVPSWIQMYEISWSLN